VSYLAVDLSIYMRLVGYPIESDGHPKLDSKGIPVNRLLVGPPNSPEGRERLPSYGLRIPNLKDGRTTSGPKGGGMPYMLRDISKDTFKQIPVWPVNVKGMPPENKWPCVTFHWHDEEFNSQTYIYDDPFRTDAPTAPTVEVVNRNGEVIASGKSRVRFRPHPDEYDLTYVIRVWSKDAVELRLICAAVKKLFPARGVLEVEQSDGSVHPCDMMQQGFVNLDEGGDFNVNATVQSGNQRGYSRAFLYKIEAYQDNTTDVDQIWEERVVIGRILEIATAQDELISTIDVELQEPNPVVDGG
jgi:hypothetical protein